MKSVSETGLIKIFATCSPDKPMPNRATISDVARLAGVSKSTVSRVLNNNLRYIRPETIEQVRNSIEALGYQPSSVARSLVSKRTLSVGLLISDVGNPFYSEVIRGVEEIALQQNYNGFLCNTSYDHARGLKFVQSLVNKQVDGVLLMSSSVSDKWVNELARCRTPVVALDWHPTAPVNEGAVGVIGVDFEAGIRQAVNHLIELGHRCFAHVSGPLGLHTSRARQQAFLRALENHGISSESVVTLEANLRLDGGRGALEHLALLPEPPTGVFAANDLTAIGLVWAAQQSGLLIPEDLSVIGLDDIQLAAEILPPLTTVAMPRSEIGQMAMEMLLELIENAPDAKGIAHSIDVSTSLVVRQSTGLVPALVKSWRSS